jgi:hypothetical protein
MWEVVLLAPVEEWFLALCKADLTTANRVMEAIDHLAEAGPSLGRPDGRPAPMGVACTT